MAFDLNNLSDTRRRLVIHINQEGQATISDLAQKMGLSKEAVRQQLVQLEKDGWISRTVQREEPSGAGRPSTKYSLTRAGEHLFPKNYEGLTIELIDTLVERHGREGLRDLLETMTESRVKQWAPQLEGLPLDEKVEQLQDIYRKNDEQMQHKKEGKTHLLIENNCPFLNVALERPALCSLTVSTLSRLLGARVTRTERFQDGHGRCVFKIEPGNPPVEGTFQFEDEMS